MWQYSIIVNSDKQEIIAYIYDQLKKVLDSLDGVITVFEKMENCQILIGCNHFEKNRVMLAISDAVSESICYFYKRDFLKQNLKISIGDQISKQAFLSALLFFDKETDRYIVNKYLNIENKLNLDSFFNFKLKNLKDKWQELIEIANQNEVYLYSSETFMELIKFLVDNIEIKSDVINIMSCNNSYDIFDSKFDKIDSPKISENGDQKLVALLIALCPKNINIYCSDLLPNNLKDLICRLFEKRVRFISKIN